VKSIPSIADWTARHAGDPFLIDSTTDRSWTYGAFDRKVRELATLLTSLGIKKHDRVATLLSNSPEFVALYFACLYIRATIVPINPAFHKDDITFILAHSNISLLVVSPQTHALISHSSQSVRAGILFFGNSDGTSGPSWSMDQDVNKTEVSTPTSIEPSDLWTITFTSGTTSRPKGVPHRTASLWQSACEFAAMLGYSKETRLYHVMPMSYMAGFLNTLLCPYVSGGAVVIDRPFDARLALDFWRTPIKYGVNRLCLVPTMLATLKHVDRNPAGTEYCRNNIETISVCTAPLPVSIKLTFEEKYGSQLCESYGLSETLFATTELPGLVSRLGSVGKSLASTRIEIRGRKGESLPVNTDGEVHLASTTLMAGYLDPESGEPNPVTVPQWFPTGDIGHLDDEGYLCITGRKKDLIIRGGLNISPRAVEEVLLEHPHVRDAAVIGSPHPLLGEEIIAVIEPTTGSNWNDLRTDLAHACRSRLAESARPSRMIEISEMPRSSTGKIQKQQLRESIASLLAGGLTV
jgi:long-chain acyl-CoA synthetase